MNDPLNPPAIIEMKFAEQDWEQAISMGIELSGRETEVRFQFGDLAHAVTESFGPEMFRNWAKEVGMQVSLLRRYRDVSRAIDQELRDKFPKLRWSIFRLVCSYKNKEALLQLADDNNWSVEKFEEYLKALDAGDIPEDGDENFGTGEKALPEKPELEYVEKYNCYQIANQNEDARWLEMNGVD